MEQLEKVEIINSIDNLDVDWSLQVLNIPKIWSKTRGEGVSIAVMDTGVDMRHRDLIKSVKGNINMHNKTRDVTDEHGHGTHVAGLIAGSNTGVAPETELYIAKVLNNKGLGTMANVLDGITFAINYNVDILCISLGITSNLPIIMQERILEAYNHGITIVCATGNSNTNVEYPAFYDHIIGVGGVNRNLERAEFSNYGNGIDFVAPSTEILSTYKDSNYARMSGTSMASPIIAGIIALIISYNRKKGIELSPREIKEILINNANKEWNEYVGWGLIDTKKIFNILD